MSADGVKKTHISEMEKIIKNAVSETSKLLETIIEELKGEVLKVKSQNENLKIRCSQFEEVLKKRSVYRETGTSPEPYIIEKCDKAVQCDLLQQAPIVEQDPVLFLLPDQEPQNDDQPNPLPENETQDDENSATSGVVTEKESSNDSFSKMKDVKLNVSGQVETEEPLFNRMFTTNEDMSVDESSLEPLLKNMEYSVSLETKNLPRESEHLSIMPSPQDNIQKESETCDEISEMETLEEFQEEELDLSQKEVDIEVAEKEETLLVCQESQKEPDEQTLLPLHEGIHVTQTEDGVNSETSNTELGDCEASIFPDLSPCHERTNLSNSPQHAAEEIAVVQTYQHENSSEFKTSNASTADNTNTVSEVKTLVQPDNRISIDTLSSSAITKSQLKDKQHNGPASPPFSLSESEQLLTETEAKSIQAVPLEGSPPNQAQNTARIISPPAPSPQQRQRCTSVSLEDAMLLLDAVNQQKYKPSSLTAGQTQDSPQVCNVDFSKTVNNLVVSATLHFSDESIDPEENAPTTEPLVQDNRDKSETMQAIVCPANADIDSQQHDHKASVVTPPSNPSSTVEPARDDMPHLTPQNPEETAEVIQYSHGQVHNYNEVNEPDLTASTSFPEPVLSTEPEAQHTIPQISSSTPNTTKALEIYSHQTHIGTKSQKTDPTVSSATLLSKTLSTVSPSTNHILTKMSTNPGEQNSPVLHKNTSPKALSPEQLTAVVSAVRSTTNTHLPKYTSANTTCGKKTLIAVPFSLQTVMKPHHKIIVIPRQCKATQTQSVTTKDKAIFLKKRQITDHTTPTHTGNSTAPVNTGTTLGKDNTTVPQERESVSDNMDLHRQPASVSKTTLSPAETTALEMLGPLTTSSAVKPQRKNSVEVKLSRIPFPMSVAQSILISNISSNGSSEITGLNTAPSSLRVKAPCVFSKVFQNSEDPSKSQAQPLMDKLTKPAGVIVPSAALPISENTILQAFKEQSINSVEEKHSSIIQLSPVLSSDHSYPQLCMTKLQFLAQLEMSPVIQVSKKADFNGKDAQKTSLVARLRRHLKPCLQTGRTKHKTETGLENYSSNLTGVTAKEKTDATYISHKTPGPDYDHACDISKKSGLSDNIPHVRRDTAVNSGRSIVTKNVSNNGQIERKSSAVSPERDSLTATVKKPRLKMDEATSEYNDKCLSQNIWIPSVKQPGLKATATNVATKCQDASDSSIPIAVNILNSNSALMSCLRRRQGQRSGVRRKSFLCKFCRKEFHKKKDIEAHVQIHAGKKPFQCTFCERKFSRTVELTRHLKRHSAEKKFQCSFCGKAFVEYNNLKRHSYIHTGEKPFSCPHCPRTFTQSGHMRTHIRTAHKTKER